jgi:hypothetical protein
MQKLAIDAMQGGFEEIAFSWIFTVKQIQQLRGV